MCQGDCQTQGRFLHVSVQPVLRFPLLLAVIQCAVFSIIRQAGVVPVWIYICVALESTVCVKIVTNLNGRTGRGQNEHL